MEGVNWRNDPHKREYVEKTFKESNFAMGGSFFL
jgi:hypothetical protein